MRRLRLLVAPLLALCVLVCLSCSDSPSATAKREVYAQTLAFAVAQTRDALVGFRGVDEPAEFEARAERALDLVTSAAEALAAANPPREAMETHENLKGAYIQVRTTLRELTVISPGAGVEGIVAKLEQLESPLKQIGSELHHLATLGYPASKRAEAG